jgi:hypothetical protein
VKWTVAVIAICLLGTALVVLLWNPDPPKVQLPPPPKPPAVDPRLEHQIGDKPVIDQPQKYAMRDVPVRVGGAPGSASEPPPATGGESGKGGGFSGEAWKLSDTRGVLVQSDGGGAKRFFPDHDGIRAAMKSAVPEIRDCYEQWLQTNPELKGKMTMSFSISPPDAGAGRVEDLAVSSTDIAHLGFEGCVKNVMAGLDFATPYDDGTGEPAPMQVKYPLTFSSGDGG